MLASGLTNPRCTVDCLQLHQAWQQPLSHAALLRHRGVTHRPFVRHRQTECRSGALAHFQTCKMRAPSAAACLLTIASSYVMCDLIC